LGDQYINAGPGVPKVGGPVHPVPMVVAPMTDITTEFNVLTYSEHTHSLKNNRPTAIIHVASGLMHPVVSASTVFVRMPSVHRFRASARLLGTSHDMTDQSV
jgi:hypothetical protein